MEQGLRIASPAADLPPWSPQLGIVGGPRVTLAGLLEVLLRGEGEALGASGCFS